MSHGHPSLPAWNKPPIQPPILYHTQAGSHTLPGGWRWINGVWRKQTEGAELEAWPLGWVRHSVDVGAIGGLNHARDPYLPQGLCVVEDTYFPCPQCGFDRVFNTEDRAAIPFHETTEARLMPEEGATEEEYDKAHDIAEKKESEFRREKFGATCRAVRD